MLDAYQTLALFRNERAMGVVAHENTAFRDPSDRLTAWVAGTMGGGVGVSKAKAPWTLQPA
ncbi:hypothetical protein SAMD00023353_4001290 [Rosellinia necatrix]|uniref:Uncharacterized protein n=1 Tax=Rosellinia necatrix TaxID=77044 RepID=A0A1S8A977_ROSNE|nr:hypothetical protein SAMD00023353_4001290 [Rosellinia necatrix]